MRILFYLLVTTTLIFGVSAQQTLQMSLDECLKYALENNQDVQVAKLENYISEGQIKETLSDGLPQINANVGLTNNIKIPVSFLPAFDGSGEIQPFEFGTNWTSNAGIDVSQLIFDGSFFVGLQASRTVKLLTEKEQRRAEVDVIEAVSKAYYLVLINQRNLEFLARNFATIDTLLLETQAQYDNGFVEKIDVSRIKIQHNNLRTDLRNNTAALVVSLNLLKFQMGMPVGTRLELTDELIEDDFPVLDLDTAGAIYRRPEYEVLQTNKSLVNLNIKNFNSQYLPNLYANFGLGWNSGAETFGDLSTINSRTWPRYTSVGLNLSIPIFDGLRKSATIQQNRVQLQQLDQNISQLENGIEQEIQSSVIGYDNALREVDTQKENLDLANEVYQTTVIKYQEGVGSNIEVVNTITDYEEARNNYLVALYDAATAYIELKKALGTLDQL